MFWIKIKVGNETHAKILLTTRVNSLSGTRQLLLKLWQ